QSLVDDRLDRLAVSPDLAEQHGALNGTEAEVGHVLFVRLGRQTSERLLLDEEARKLVLDHLEDETEVLPDQLVLLRPLVSHRPEGTAPRHAEALLHFDLCEEPTLQIVPRRNLVTDPGAAGLDLLQIGLQHLVDESLLALEVVVELALARAGGLDDLVRARRADPLLVKQVGGRPDDAESRFRALRRSRHSSLSNMYQLVQPRDTALVDPVENGREGLYLI